MGEGVSKVVISTPDNENESTQSLKRRMLCVKEEARDKPGSDGNVIRSKKARKLG